MQEIKFRVWNKTANGMLDWYFVREAPFGQLTGKSHLIPMQYTGHNDKNGKEIYQGDIVKTIAFPEHPEDTVTSDIIRQYDGQWSVRAIDDKKDDSIVYEHGLPLNWGGYKSIEVIGNIYENPELLK